MHFPSAAKLITFYFYALRLQPLRFASLDRALRPRKCEINLAGIDNLLLGLAALKSFWLLPEEVKIITTGQRLLLFNLGHSVFGMLNNQGFKGCFKKALKVNENYKI